MFDAVPAGGAVPRPGADVDAADGFDAAPVAVDVPPESGGTVFPGAGEVTLPGVALPPSGPGFPVDETVPPPEGDVFEFAGTHGSAAGGFGAGGGITAGMFAGLPVGVGWPGAVVDAGV